MLRQQLQPDDAALKAYFDEMQSAEQTRQIKVRHILVDTEEKANEIKARLDAGADFAQLAQAESKDTASAAKGGDLGLIGKGDTVSEFEAAAFALSDGEISAPVQSTYGWHIIQATCCTLSRRKQTILEQYLNEKVSARLGTWYSELRENAQITNTLPSKRLRPGQARGQPPGLLAHERGWCRVDPRSRWRLFLLVGVAAPAAMGAGGLLLARLVTGRFPDLLRLPSGQATLAGLAAGGPPWAWSGCSPGSAAGWRMPCGGRAPGRARRRCSPSGIR